MKFKMPSDNDVLIGIVLAGFFFIVIIGSCTAKIVLAEEPVLLEPNREVMQQDGRMLRTQPLGGGNTVVTGETDQPVIVSPPNRGTGSSRSIDLKTGEIRQIRPRNSGRGFKVDE